jgi:vitamin B12 transporter
LTLPAHGAENPPPLGSSIVTATRTATEIDEVLAPVIVISREELERSLAPDIASLLQFHAGIDVGRNGGPGQFTSIFIRGTDSNHATVLIDGVRINPGTIGNAPLQNISPELIERIEIVKGPRSTLYGTDAIGGVVNIITRGHEGSGVEASAGMGQYDTREATVSGGYGGEKGDIDVSAAWFDTEGFPTRTTGTEDRGYDNTSFNLKGRLLLGGVELGLRAWHAEGNSEYLGFFPSDLFDQDFENSTVATEAALRPYEPWLTRLTLSHIEDDIRQQQSEDRVRTRRNTLDWQNDFVLAAHDVLTAGAQLTRENALSVDQFGSGFDVDTDVNMLFAQNRLDAGRHNLLLAVAWLDHNTFGNETTWNVDYGLDLGEHTRVVASAGEAFRAPDATDRFGFGGDPDLEPEVSRNYELGLQHRVGIAHEFTLSAFQNTIDDLIEFVFDPTTGGGTNRNVARARIEGLEVAYAFSSELWHVRVEAITQDPQNLTDNTRLLRRARDSLTLTLVRTFDRLELGLDALTTGQRKDFGNVTLDGYTLLNLTGRYSFSDAWSVQARLENALDENYQLANGFRTPERSLFVATRFSFR